MPGDEEETDDTNLDAGGTPPAQPPPAAAPPVRGHGGVIPEERISEIRRAEREKERKRVWKELYGTDDEKEVQRIVAEQKAKAQKADEMEAEREKAKLAELTENERLKRELETERQQRADEKKRLETERDREREARELQQQDLQITGLATKHIAPKFLKTAKVDFNEYVEKLSKTELAALDDKAITKWFAEYAKNNPEFAPQKPAPAKTQEEIDKEAKARAREITPVKRAPIGAPRGAAPRTPPPAARPLTGPGTYKGKKVKDLNRKELAEYAKTQGLKKLPY